MFVARKGKDMMVVGNFARMAKTLGSKRGRREMYRGLVDAGRIMKTDTQRVVTGQMALKKGNYRGYVVANTRGVGDEAALTFDIFSRRGGIKAQNYKGLRSVKASSALSTKMNSGRDVFDRGTVRSDVWNNPRIFKRSFEHKDKFYMMRTREAGVKAPRILWTHDDRSWQPRSSRGRFASTGARWGKIRQLYGPALSKEIPDGKSAQNFKQRAPLVLQASVTKRLEKLLRY